MCAFVLEYDVLCFVYFLEICAVIQHENSWTFPLCRNFLYCRPLFLCRVTGLVSAPCCSGWAFWAPPTAQVMCSTGKSSWYAKAFGAHKVDSNSSRNISERNNFCREVSFIAHGNSEHKKAALSRQY